MDKGFEQAGIDGFQRTLHFYMPGGEIPQDDRFVKLCLEERERQFGIKSDPQPFDASCEQCFLAREESRPLSAVPEIMPGPYSGGIYLEKQVQDAVKPVWRIIDRVLL